MLEPSGLRICQSKPCIAASPDGLVECSCHGRGLVEIKCPYKHHLDKVTEIAKCGDSGLKYSTSGNVEVNPNHQYYFQMKTQMICTGRDYCDFVIFTVAKTDNIGIYRVQKDDSCAYQILQRAPLFWHKVIVPELRTGLVYNSVVDMYVKKTLDKILDKVSRND